MIKAMTQAPAMNTNALKHFLVAEISETTFHALEIKRSAKVLEVVSRIDLDLTIQAEEDQDSEVPELIQRALQKSGLGRLPMLLAISAEDATLKQLSLPQTNDDNELAAMIQMQIPNELPFDGNEAIVDYLVNEADNEEDNTQSIMLAALREERLQSIRQWQQEANFHLHTLTLSSIAAWQQITSTTECKEDEQHCLILLNNHDVQMIVFSASQLLYDTHFTLNHALSALDQEAQHDALDMICHQIQRQLLTFTGPMMDSRIHSTTLAGNSGLEISLKDLLHRNNIPDVMLWEAPTNDKKAKITLHGADLILLGLAQSHMKSELQQVNFLAPKKPLKKKSLLKPLIAVTVLSLLLAGGFGIYQANNHVNTRKKNLGKLQAEFKQLRDDVKATRSLVKQNTAVQEWLSQEDQWLDHFARITAAFPPAEQAYLMSFDTNPDSSFNIRARYKNDQILSQMIQQLSDLGYTVTEIGGHQPRNDKYEYSFETSFRIYSPDLSKKDKLPLIQVSDLSAPARPADDDSINRLKQKPKSSTRRRY